MHSPEILMPVFRITYIGKSNGKKVVKNQSLWFWKELIRLLVTQGHDSVIYVPIPWGDVSVSSYLLNWSGCFSTFNTVYLHNAGLVSHISMHVWYAEFRNMHTHIQAGTQAHTHTHAHYIIYTPNVLFQGQPMSWWILKIKAVTNFCAWMCKS